MIRSGHAYAQASALHPGFCLRENASIAFWGLAFPAASLALAPASGGASLLLLAVYPLQIARIARRVGRGRSRADAWSWAAACVVGKWAQHVGQWKYLAAHARGRLPRLIEYKGAAD
jgi:hypothetical protein